MQYIKELITDKTPIINLKNEYPLMPHEKEKVLGEFSGVEARKDKYLEMMYYMNNNWYYFKKEEDNFGYPFYLIDELMGSFLANKINLNGLDFQIAKRKKDIGLASPNFKCSTYNYYFANFIDEEYRTFFNKSKQLSIIIFEELKLALQKYSTVEKFIDNLLAMVALDIYMLQTDRSISNIQIKVSDSLIYLAPLYDFANCSSAIDKKGLLLKNYFCNIDDTNIKALVTRYPVVANYLLNLLEVGFVSTWAQICDYYKFDKNSQAYLEIYNYYKTKEEEQKNIYIKMFYKKSIDLNLGL